MNIVDIIILGVVGISVIYGFYHGFIHTVASLVAALLSIMAAFSFGPRVAEIFITNPAVTSFLSTYTDSVVRVGDFDLASSPVVSIGRTTIETILRSVNLPEPLAKVLEQNLLNQSFGGGQTTVNTYVSNTIIAAAVQVISYLLVFAAAYIILSFIISLIKHVMDFPILKQLDWLAGGVFGVLRGGVLVYLLLLLVPLISTVLPADGIGKLIADSSLAHLFSSDGFFIRVISQ